MDRQYKGTITFHFTQMLIFERIMSTRSPDTCTLSTTVTVRSLCGGNLVFPRSEMGKKLSWCCKWTLLKSLGFILMK